MLKKGAIGQKKREREKKQEREQKQEKGAQSQLRSG